MNRDKRQEECIKKWIENKGCGTLSLPTGFGKTRVALLTIKKLKDKYPDKKVIVIVPTIPLKEQWTILIDSWGLGFNTDVLVINTAAKNQYQCDLLIIDEYHRAAANQLIKIFDNISYKLILCLTATLERLDGRHTLLEQKAPIIDSLTMKEALNNGWVSEYKEYMVLIDVPDIEEYKKLNKRFVACFEIFNFDFNLAMSMIGKDGFKNRIEYCNKICPKHYTNSQKSELLKNITTSSMLFSKTIQERKKFINQHPKKIELTNMIIEKRSDKKIITFSNNHKIAKTIKYGKSYVGQTKKNDSTLEEFKKGEFNVLNSVAKLNEGFDCPGLSVAIILGLDSSKIKAIQRLGRVVRREENKQAEIFNLVINNSAEVEWFKKSHANSAYTVIDEEQLMNILDNKEFQEYKKPIPKLNFRF